MKSLPGTTLVTCLFDLAKRECSHDRRNGAQYIEAAEQSVFGLDCDLVVFADPEWVEPITSARRARGLAARTRVIGVALEDLRSYALLDAITRARLEHPLQNGDPAKDTPLYTVLLWAKFELVARVVADAIPTGHLGWIDIGLSSVPYAGEDPFAAPPDRVRLLMLRPFFASELSREGYFCRIRPHLAGGYICGSVENMAWFAARFDELARATLASGFAASDEQLLPLIASADPDRFDFHHGDYSHALTNFLRPHGSAANLTFQLRVWRDGQAPGAGAALARDIVAAIEAGQFDAEPATLAALLDECFLAAYYGGDEPRLLARRIVDLYLQLAESDGAFREVFLLDEIRIRKNFGFVADG